MRARGYYVLQTIRRLIGLTILMLAPTLAGIPVSAAEGVNCDYYATQEQAQRHYREFDHLKWSLDPDGNGVACEELPSLADAAPPALANAYLERLQGGSEGNQVVVAPKIEVTLAGLAPFRATASRVDCPTLLTDNPVEELIKFDANVFVTSASGERITEHHTDVHDGVLWVWDGETEPVNVNVWLVQNGFALWDPDTTPPDLLRDFSAGESTARSQRLGIWGACDVERSMIVPRFAPQSLRDQITHVTTLYGTWGKPGTFEVPQDGYYNVNVRATKASSYIEIAVLKNMATGEEYPQFYWTLFGPDTYTAQVYFSAGTYRFDCRAAGGWSFTVESIPSR